jgi:hypothetical protein
MNCKSGISTLLVAVFILGAALNFPAYAGASAVNAPALNNTAKQSTEDVKRMENVASLNEDLIDYIFAGDTAQIATGAKDIADATSQLKPALDERTYFAVTSRLAEQQKALTKRDMTGAALAAVEMYRVLQEAIDPALRPAPLQISMLDYSGFKIVALSRAAPPNWEAIDRAVRDMTGNWNELVPQIKDKALRDLVTSIEDGLAQASARKDAAYLAFAGRMLLDAVDLLEGQLS